MGFMSENISRGVNTYRPFYFPKGGTPFAKPRFEVHGDELVLIPNPAPTLDAYRELIRNPEKQLARFGEHDYYYRRDSRHSRLDVLPSVRFARVIARQYLHQPIRVGGVYNRSSEAYRVALRTFEEFAREARSNGSLPVAVLFPDRGDLRAHRAGRPPSYAPLRADLERDGIRVIDLLAAFDRYDPEGALARRDFIHYPRDGNRMVGSYVRDYLVEHGLDRPSSFPRSAWERTLDAPRPALTSPPLLSQPPARRPGEEGDRRSYHERGRVRRPPGPHLPDPPLPTHPAAPTRERRERTPGKLHSSTVSASRQAAASWSGVPRSR
jgi:hypothetical protein